MILLSTEEFAKKLGYSAGHLSTLVAKGTIQPYQRVGKALVWRECDVKPIKAKIEEHSTAARSAGLKAAHADKKYQYQEQLDRIEAKLDRLLEVWK